MNLNQRLLVCESMLARLDAALAIADAESGCANAAELKMRTLLSRLEAEHQRRDSKSGVFTRPETRPRERTQRSRSANDNSRQGGAADLIPVVRYNG